MSKSDKRDDTSRIVEQHFKALIVEPQNGAAVRDGQGAQVDQRAVA